MGMDTTSRIDFYIARAAECEALAFQRSGEVRRSLLRSAAQYRSTGANIARRGY